VNTPLIFGFIALGFLWYNLYVTISIIKYLKSKGEDASLFSGGIYIKGKIFKYLPMYEEHTYKEEGRVGGLYTQFYISFVGLMISLFIGIMSVAF
jgi:hypothetical protein